MRELPVDLVWLIGVLLSPEDPRSLRLVCRDLYDKTFDSFASMFLRSISTDLTAPSLSQINALCKRGRRACGYVQSLSFLARGTSHLSCGSWNTDLFWDPDRNSPLDVAQVRTSRDNLLHSLVNCRSFSICYYQHSRYQFDPTDLPFSECVAVFLAIIVDTGIPVTSFQFLGPRGGMHYVDDLHHVLSPWPELSTVWAHLQDLCLHWPSNRSYMRTCLHSPFLLSAVQCAPRLRKLYINFYASEASAFIGKLATTEDLPHIQDLTLESGNVKEQYLQEFLQRLQKSLRVLILHNICLGGHGDGSLIRAAFVDNAPNLRSISVSRISDGFGDTTASMSAPIYDFPAFLQAPFAQSDLRQQCYLTGSHIDAPCIAPARYAAHLPCVLGVQYSGPFMRETQSKIRTGSKVRIIEDHKLNDKSLGGGRVSLLKREERNFPLLRSHRVIDR